DIDALLAPFASRAAFAHATRVVARHLWSRAKRGRTTRLVMGNALVGMLLLSLREASVEIMINTMVDELLTDGDGRVVGAVVTDGAGRPERIEAKRGVVLATGGFGKSAKWRAQLLDVADDGYCVGAPGL